MFRKNKKSQPEPDAEALFRDERQEIADAVKETLLNDAYTLLDITPAAIAAVPRIEHIFRRMGGAARIFEYLEGSDEPEARAILQKRREVTKAMAEAMPFEAFCVAAGVSTKKALWIISAEVMEQSAKESALLARTMHPEVVNYTIQQAMTPAGTQERKMLHQAAGFLPMPKGNLNVFGNVGIDNRQQQVNVAVLPPVEDSVKRMSDRFGEMMEPAKAIEAPVVYDDKEGDDEN